MRFHRPARRIVLVPALALAAVTTAVTTAATTACSGGPSPRSSPSPSPAGSPKAAGNPTAVIKTNWERFFAGKTPAAERVSLLQDGQAFAKTISAMSGLGTSASAKVSAVRLASPERAAVTYTVYLGTIKALPDEKGTAVLDNGVWKVSDGSFCQLLALQNGGKAPSVCNSAR